MSHRMGPSSDDGDSIRTATIIDNQNIKIAMPATPTEGSGSPPSRHGHGTDGKARMRSDDFPRREDARSRRDPLAAWALAVAIVAAILAAAALALAVGLMFLLPQQDSTVTRSCCGPHQAQTDFSAAMQTSQQGSSSEARDSRRSDSSDSSDISETVSLVALSPPALPSPPPYAQFPFKSSSSSSLEDSERSSEGPAKSDLTSHPIADLSESTDEESTTPIYSPSMPAVPPRPSAPPPPTARPPAPGPVVPVNSDSDEGDSPNDDSTSESPAHNLQNATASGHNLCPQSFDCRTPRGIPGFMDGRCICQCLGGRTGLSCEVEPSMSNLEGDGATKILTVVALNASSGAAINAVDQNLTTFWEVSAEDGDAWLVFDLGMPLRLLGLALRNKYRVGPARNEYVLQFSANDEFGPWSDALNFRPQHSLDWQYFGIQPDLPTRFVRVFVRFGERDAMRGAHIKEIEFFTPRTHELGIPADLFPRCMPPGGNLVFQGLQWACQCGSGWKGSSCEILVTPEGSLLPRVLPPASGNSPARICTPGTCFFYKDSVYRTLDGIGYKASTNASCDETWRPIPEGWQLAATKHYSEDDLQTVAASNGRWGAVALRVNSTHAVNSTSTYRFVQKTGGSSRNPVYSDLLLPKDSTSFPVLYKPCMPELFVRREYNRYGNFIEVDVGTYTAWRVLIKWTPDSSDEKV